MERDIDLVIPMVFPQDPEWQREYRRRCGGSTAGDAAGTVGNVRWRSWGTEELLVKCCMKYMPWLRCIYILLAQESQARFLNGGYESHEATAGEAAGTVPEVRLVFHREFMPAEVLPCFSSPCIEMFLHRIPGLSERFIYANDDMFPLSPLEPDDFFYYRATNAADVVKGVAGAELFTLCSPLLPCQHIYELAYPKNPNIFQRKCMWQQNMVGRAFGQQYARTWLRNGHSFAAILKSSCEEVWRRYGKEIRRNLSSLKRTDRSANHYIYQLYQYFTGMYVDHDLKKQYVGDGVATDRLADIIRDPQAGIVCINDNEKEKDWKRRAEIVRREIEAKLDNS